MNQKNNITVQKSGNKSLYYKGPDLVLVLYNNNIDGTLWHLYNIEMQYLVQKLNPSKEEVDVVTLAIACLIEALRDPVLYHEYTWHAHKYPELDLLVQNKREEQLKAIENLEEVEVYI